MQTTQSNADIEIGLTPYDMGDGSIMYAGIRVNGEGEFMARTPAGDLKRYTSIKAAAKFLAARGYTPKGRKL